MKIRLAYTLLIIAAMSTARAGYIEDKDGKTIIHVVCAPAVLPNPLNTSPFGKAESAGVKLFKKKFKQIFIEKYRDKYKANPEKYGTHNWDNVEVNFIKATGIRVEGVETDLLQIAGDIAPDILYVNFRKSDTYIRSGFLYPLDKAEDGYLTDMTQEELDFRINKKIWPVIKRKGPQGKKQVWAIPYGGAIGKVLMFRKDRFDELKIPYPDKDWTWDDMMAAAKKLTDPANGYYGLLLGRGIHESWHWITFLWSAGGEVMVYNEKTDTWSCTFDTDEAAVALDFYTRMSAEKWIDAKGKVRRGYSSKDAAESSYKIWNRGQIGMMQDYVDEKLFSQINPETTGMAPVPLGPTGIRGAELNSRMMGLYAKIKHPAVRDVAWEYMKHYDSKETSALKTKIMVEGGLGRYVNPKYLRMFGYGFMERLSPKGWVETFNIAIASGKPEPYGKNSNIAYDLMTKPLQEAEQLMLNNKLPKNREARLKILKAILVKANARANEEMIGVISPEERRNRRIAAVSVLICVIIGFVFVFKRIFKIFSPPETYGIKKKKWDFKRYFWAYMLLLPAVLCILVWQYIPLLRGSYMAFFDYQLVLESSFVGVDNFGDLLWNRDFWVSIWNAIRYSGMVLAFTFLPPIILAILLQEVPKGKILFRTIYYLPAVISGLVVILLWKQFYEPSENGALNAIVLQIPLIGFVLIGLAIFALLSVFGVRLRLHEMKWQSNAFFIAGVVLCGSVISLGKTIMIKDGETLVSALPHLVSRLFNVMPEPSNWLANPDTAMICCIVPMVWAGMGPGCLIYLAALKGIPDDFYEAADIDGANFIDKILFVVFPNLKALIIINFIGAFIASWYTATGAILMMTGGAANTEVVGLHIWKKAFTYLKFGPATAMAWVLGFMLIGFTMHQLKILSNLEFKTTGGDD
ncbi:MAG: extracellular solute-binding protein [Lentisphaeria bacterium]|nr:extracellular solute-binding protein [Lentisphaeria bacterium]NQZ66607.1 extracellular solute-binding protein [Lentisphaeria bacterium]